MFTISFHLYISIQYSYIHTVGKCRRFSTIASGEQEGVLEVLLKRCCIPLWTVFALLKVTKCLNAAFVCFLKENLTHSGSIVSLSRPLGSQDGAKTDKCSRDSRNWAIRDTCGVRGGTEFYTIPLHWKSIAVLRLKRPSSWVGIRFITLRIILVDHWGM